MSHDGSQLQSVEVKTLVRLYSNCGGFVPLLVGVISNLIVVTVPSYEETQRLEVETLVAERLVAEDKANVLARLKGCILSSLSMSKSR